MAGTSLAMTKYQRDYGVIFHFKYPCARNQAIAAATASA
jgi:hypothetical protein